jgi:23S rRNA A2030 N6-methylase RlmJ
MTQEDLQKKYDRLVDKVRRMRGWQKEYQKYHASSDRELAKRFEREVDQLVKDEVDRKNSKQLEL